MDVPTLLSGREKLFWFTPVFANSEWGKAGLHFLFALGEDAVTWSFSTLICLDEPTRRDLVFLLGVSWGNWCSLICLGRVDFREVTGPNYLKSDQFKACGFREGCTSVRATSEAGN